jgi:hypothetical protein
VANALYPLGAKGILDGTFGNMVSADLRFMLVDTGVETYNAADQFVSNITSPVARMAASLASKTTNVPTNGTLDAADPTINSVTGATVEAVVLYLFNASDAAAPLLAWIDSSPTIAFTPNGSNVTLQLDANGIFSI